MKINWKYILGVIALTLTLLSGVGYWYVFQEGAPQFDPPNTSAQGTDLNFQMKSFFSQAMGSQRQYGLILPRNYDQNPDKRYPVIFFLHGGHDNQYAWVDKYGLIPVLSKLYDTSKLPESIIITPDGNDKRGSSPLFDPDYFDGPNGKINTLIGSELVKEIKSRYRTYNDPRLWAIGGLSSGGWGAVNIGLKNLNNFCVMFSHLGYFTDSSGSANSPSAFVQKIPQAKLQFARIYMDAGRADADFLADNQKFHQILARLGVQNVFYIFPGGHGITGPDYGWNYINKHSVDSLTYVGQQFQQVLQK